MVSDLATRMPKDDRSNTKEGDYGNFKQPVRLAWKMIQSHNRAAISALGHHALKIVAKPLDGFLMRREANLLGEDLGATLPVLLVVGAPRSGTTLVYQTIANCCRVSYFTNLTAMFPRSPLSATRFFGQSFQRQRIDFESYYGYMAGFAGPNDGFAIWNRWLGTDRYATQSELPESMKLEMRQFFRAWSKAFGLPFLNKNNRNTMCVKLLADAIPEAHFIVVRRNPVFVAQSLIQARESIQGDKKAEWGLQSRAIRSAMDELGYVDDVCDQLIDIESQLSAELDSIATPRLHCIQYETFCREPLAFLESLRSAIPSLTLDQPTIDQHLKPFRVSQRDTATPEELARIHARFPLSSQ